LIYAYQAEKRVNKQGLFLVYAHRPGFGAKSNWNTFKIDIILEKKTFF
jgi:hypothetical protein